MTILVVNANIQSPDHQGWRVAMGIKDYHCFLSTEADWILTILTEGSPEKETSAPLPKSSSIDSTGLTSAETPVRATIALPVLRAEAFRL